MVFSQGVRMGETSTNIANINMREAMRVRVKDGCDVPDTCQSNQCPTHSRCRDTWSSHTCVCVPGNTISVEWTLISLLQNFKTPVSLNFTHCAFKCFSAPGYFGRDCVDACLLNPCEHTSTCVRAPGTKHGYRCHCGLNYYGQNCEHKWVSFFFSFGTFIVFFYCLFG